MSNLHIAPQQVDAGDRRVDSLQLRRLLVSITATAKSCLAAVLWRVSFLQAAEVPAVASSLSHLPHYLDQGTLLDMHPAALISWSMICKYAISRQKGPHVIAYWHPLHAACLQMHLAPWQEMRKRNSNKICIRRAGHALTFWCHCRACQH